MKKNNQAGQALLIVLLSLSVVLIIVLSIVSRSITDISLSTSDEESVRAFSAAEAGIEQALIIGSNTSSTIGDANFSATVSSFASGQTGVSYPLNLKSGNTATFWFVGHNDDGTTGCGEEPCFTGSQVRFCWGNAGTSDSSADTPAIETTFFYETTPGVPSSVQVARALYDPYNARLSSNNFSPAANSLCEIDGESYQFQATVDLDSLGISNYATPNALKFAKVKMLYNTTTSQKLGLDANFAGNATLPSQGIKVDSSGSYGDSNRRIEVYELHATTPTIFDSVVFSSSGITK